MLFFLMDVLHCILRLSAEGEVYVEPAESETHLKEAASNGRCGNFDFYTSATLTNTRLAYDWKAGRQWASADE